MIHAPEHTKSIFNPYIFKAMVIDASAMVMELQKQLKFTYIVGCGMSGIPLVTAVSLRTDIPMWVVRNAHTDHDKRKVNGFLKEGTDRSYLIIDDLISTGSTVDHIIKSMFNEPMWFEGAYATYTDSKLEMVPAGVLTYNEKYDGFLDECCLYQSPLGVIPTFFLYE